MIRVLFIVITSLAIFSCSNQREAHMQFTGAKGEVKLITINPGHFHAALVQKVMYDQVSPTVFVFAPEGSDLDDHLNRIEGFNTRQDNPTSWKEKVYKGPDFLEKLIAKKPGNVLVTSGNNLKKTEYIKSAVDAGINVLADKPMCINAEGFELLKSAFESAERNGVLLYDIMTERYEITTILQKEFAAIPEVFGELLPGTPDDPAVTKESVHHVFKYVAGNPIKRPVWYFDVTQQGEGMVDVATHLVDLVMWECFPEQIIDFREDIQMLSARHWPTIVNQQQFEKVTRQSEFPDYFKDDLDENGALPCFCNGEMTYKIKGINAKVSVIWNFEAPEGTGDTHYSIMKGSKANVIIRQGKTENYKPKLYIESVGPEKGLKSALENVMAVLQEKYPGIELVKEKTGWSVNIPQKYHVGHEAHFGQVTEKYLKFLVDGTLPFWEVPNMIAKYYTTTTALEMAQK
ncbi:oxidoreductase [candidate division KSB1 bacterium]|nr:oxidoreductase [candidate division KSB1 bacterium]